MVTFSDGSTIAYTYGADGTKLKTVHKTGSTTTLSISPHKDAKRINAIGQELEAEFGVKHLPSDFKKHNGYLRSLQLSEEYGLYRQDYCGCEFSAKARGIEKY